MINNKRQAKGKLGQMPIDSTKKRLAAFYTGGDVFQKHSITLTGSHPGQPITKWYLRIRSVNSSGCCE